MGSFEKLYRAIRKHPENFHVPIISSDQLEALVMVGEKK